MRKVLPTFMLIALFLGTASFVEAAPKSLRNDSETAEKKTAPKIVRFVGQIGGHCDVDIKASEKEALARANVWIRNTPRIRIISLSVAGNYYAESVACPAGYSSVTILYEAM